MSKSVFDDAVSVFERDDDHSLSVTDAASIALCDHHDVDAIVSFDDD